MEQSLYDLPESSFSQVKKIVAQASTTMIMEFLADTYEHLKKLPTIMDVKDFTGDIGVIGDLHGDLQVAHSFAKYFLEDEVQHLIFLGDYIDRGSFGLETLFYVFSLFLKYPDKIVLLKGNHEDPAIYSRYGFYFEGKEKLGKHGHEFINSFFKNVNAIFNELMLACISPSKSFCVHGGIPIDTPSIEELQKIPKPYSRLKQDEYQKEHKWYEQLLWNDPGHNLSSGYSDSLRGSGVYVFSKELLERFLEKNDLNRIVRGHEATRGKYEELWSGKLIHVHPTRFSSINDPTQVPVFYIESNDNGFSIKTKKLDDK